MSISYDLDCGDETITLELLDDGTLICHSIDFDLESEIIAKEMGFEPHSCFKAMEYALGRASRDGDVDIVEILLAAGVNIHKWNDFAIRESAAQGRADVVKLLLEHGADVHADKDYTLRLAAYNGHTDVVSILEDWIRDHG